MSILKALGKIAKKGAGMVANSFIPGSGEILSAGLGALGSIKKGDEQRKAYEANRAQSEKRYNDNRNDAFAELQRMLEETRGINDDLKAQRGEYNDDVRAQRDIARGDIASLLNEIRNSGMDIRDVGDIERDTSLDSVLRDRAGVRARQEADAQEAVPLQRQLQTELAQATPSADVLSSLIASAGGRAISKSFEDSGNRAATEISRTGSNGAKAFADLARERANALRDNDANSVLAGIEGAESIAGAKAARLSPMIAQLSSRRTAQQDGSIEAAAGQMNQARMAQNKSNLLDTMRARVSDRANVRSNIAGLAPAMLAPSSMRLQGPVAMQRSGGLNMSYMGTGTLPAVPENNTTSDLLEGGARLARMIGKKNDTSSPVPIDARGMLRRTNASMGM